MREWRKAKGITNIRKKRVVKTSEVMKKSKPDLQPNDDLENFSVKDLKKKLKDAKRELAAY